MRLGGRGEEADERGGRGGGKGEGRKKEGTQETRGWKRREVKL